jgi:uracil-DNA glycosylase family 4
MSFDPRSLGCQCDSCPLRDVGKPVPPSTNTNAKLIVLGESPGKTEQRDGRAFVGQAGYVLDQACRSTKLSRTGLHITTAVLCRTPHKKFKPKQWEAAIAACKPRLDAELASIQPRAPILAVGAKALQVTTGKAKIIPWVGAPLISNDGRVVLPTFSPALTIGTPALLPIWRIFFGRAKLLAEGRLPEWEWPPIEINSGLTQYQLLEEMRGKPLGIDVETAGLDPIRDTLLCLGLATADAAVSIKFPFENPATRVLVEDLLADASTTKVLHNASHDLLSLKYNDLLVDGPIFDTLLAHSTVGPQLPHDLGFVAAIEMHAPRWKSEFRVESDAKGSETWVKRDAGDLRLYNAKDAYMTVRLYTFLCTRLDATHQGWGLFDEYTALADIAMRMREQGMRIDSSRLDAHRKHQTQLMDAAQAAFNTAVGEGAIFKLGKAGQNDSLKALFFDKMGCRPSRYTDEGEPALDEQVLLDIIAAGSPDAAPLARTVLNFRKAAKIRSTYIDALNIDPDGHIHAIWKVHGTITGRWSSSAPNGQNWPLRMRDLVVPSADDLWIVGADFSQLELKLVALIAGDPKLLEWYNNGKDVHTLTAAMLFNGKVPPGARDIAKTVEYGFNYNISNDVTAVWKKAILTFPTLTPSRLQRYRKLWFQEHPEIRDWQLRVVTEAQSKCYVEAPLSGRRRYFQDGHVDPNEALNFPIQATAGDLTNRAILKLDAALTPRERVVAQVHDAIYLEGPDPFRLYQLLQQNMEQTVTLNGNSLHFNVDIGIAKNWRDSTKLKITRIPQCSFSDFLSQLSSLVVSPSPLPR